MHVDVVDLCNQCKKDQRKPPQLNHNSTQIPQHEGGVLEEDVQLVRQLVVHNEDVFGQSCDDTTLRVLVEKGHFRVDDGVVQPVEDAVRPQQC